MTEAMNNPVVTNPLYIVETKPEPKVDFFTAERKSAIKTAVAVVALAAFGALGGYLLGDSSLVNTLIGAGVGLSVGLTAVAYQNKDNIGNALKKAAEKIKKLASRQKEDEGVIAVDPDSKQARATYAAAEAARIEAYSKKTVDADAFYEKLNDHQLEVDADQALREMADAKAKKQSGVFSGFKGFFGF